ncbi:hypothetical protein V6Z11_A01G155200 [Gossypium hirsutum]|uniref:Uncharacterized protein n=2 Tax=Gossypium TaxID=3633 RepID=A0A5D2RU13_GOSTO|nr:hypothetical protein ES288_A01G160300v1 [Gossypium darwinii]TYI43410.1 hypothetical protein ES332_A01G167900v1 [Gossypium tomentosum]
MPTIKRGRRFSTFLHLFLYSFLLLLILTIFHHFPSISFKSIIIKPLLSIIPHNFHHSSVLRFEP